VQSPLCSAPPCKLVKTNQKFYICSDGTHTHTYIYISSHFLGTRGVAAQDIMEKVAIAELTLDRKSEDGPFGIHRPGGRPSPMAVGLFGGIIH